LNIFLDTIFSGPEIWSFISGGEEGWIAGPLFEEGLQVAVFLIGALFKTLMKSTRNWFFIKV